MASGNLALASFNFEGENTTRRSGGFLRSFMMANFIISNLLLTRINFGINFD